MRPLLTSALMLALSLVLFAAPAAAQSFETQTVATVEGTTQFFPTLAEGQGGAIFGAWREGTNGPIRAARWTGEAWEVLSSLTLSEVEASRFLDGLSLVVDGNGVLHVACRAANGVGIGAQTSIVHASLQNGQWTVRQVVSVQDNSGAFALGNPSLAFVPNQPLQMAFAAIDSRSGRTVALNHGQFDGQNWEVNALTTDSGAQARIEGVDLTVTSDGIAHLSFTRFNAQNSELELAYARVDNGEPTFERVDGGPIANIENNPNLRKPRGQTRIEVVQGNVAIAYYDSFHRDAMVANGPGNWLPIELDGANSDRGRGIAMGLNAQGKLALTYLSEPDRGLIVAVIPVVLQPPQFQVLVPGAENEETAPNLASLVTSSGDIMILSQHWTGDNTELRSHTEAVVNEPPVIAQGESIEVTMDEDGSPTPFDLTLEADDPEGDTITWSVVSDPSNGFAAAAGTGNTQVVSYAPNPEFNGTDSFTVQAEDSNGGVAQIVVNVAINPINDPPQIAQGNAVAITMSEDGSPTPFVLALSALDLEDAPSDLTWTVSTAAQNGVAGVAGDGELAAASYVPTDDFNGSDSFVLEVSDLDGATAQIVVSVTIEAVNDPPVIDPDRETIGLSVEEGGEVSAGLGVGDVDDDVSTLVWSLSGAASDGEAIVDANNTGQATITYTPNPDFSGSDSFVVQVADPGGATDTITFEIEVGPVNDGPTIDQGAEIAVTMSEDGDPTPFALTLTATDVDNIGSELSWRIATAPTEGAAQVPDTGGEIAVSYTPPINFSGSDTFTVEVSDLDGATAQIAVSVTIEPSNDAPVSISLNPNIVAADSASGVRVGVLDAVDPDGVTAFAFTLVTGDGDGDNALFTINGDELRTAQELDLGDRETLSIRVEVTDALAVFSQALAIEVGEPPANRPPVFLDGTPDAPQTVTEGDTLTFTVSAEDPDGDDVTLSVEGLPPGAAFDVGTGVYSHAPTFEEAGVFDTVFTASDGELEVSRTLSIEVFFLDADEDGLPGTWEESVDLDRNNPDSDGDGIGDFEEVGGDLDAPLDTDEDETIDALDDDSDDDTILDSEEAGDEDLDTPAVDTDDDDTPDYRDTDSDDDTVLDGDDNCRLIPNEGQEDGDENGIGDACDDDEPDPNPEPNPDPNPEPGPDAEPEPNPEPIVVSEPDDDCACQSIDARPSSLPALPLLLLALITVVLRRR